MVSTSFGWSVCPGTPSARDMSAGPTTTRSTPSVDAISSISSSADSSSIMMASVISRFDAAMCSAAGTLPNSAARLPAIMPRSPSGA